jgi:hypothetical protein
MLYDSLHGPCEQDGPARVILLIVKLSSTSFSACTSFSSNVFWRNIYYVLVSVNELLYCTFHSVSLARDFTTLAVKYSLLLICQLFPSCVYGREKVCDSWRIWNCSISWIIPSSWKATSLVSDNGRLWLLKMSWFANKARRKPPTSLARVYTSCKFGFASCFFLKVYFMLL